LWRTRNDPPPPAPGPTTPDWARNASARLHPPAPVAPVPGLSIQFGGPRRFGRGGPGGDPAREDQAAQTAAVLDAVARHVAFRVPAGLPGGYVLERGSPLSERSIRLTYAAGDDRLNVVLEHVPGPDESGRLLPSPSPDRRVWASRHGNLVIAVDVPDRGPWDF